MSSSATSPPSPEAAAAAAAAAAAQFETLLVTLDEIRRCNYSQMAAITALAYDIFITFGDEVEYIWRTKWSIPKVLFLFARYYGLIHLIILMAVATSMNVSLSFCKFYFWYYAMGGAVMFTTVVNIILVMRIHALYERSTKVLAVMIFFLVAELGIELYASIISGIQTTAQVMPAPPGIPLTGCLTLPPKTDYTIPSWISCLFVATMFFGLTIAKFINFLRKTRVKWSVSKVADTRFLSPLLQAFYRDGSVFFLLIFAVVLVSTVTIFTITDGPLKAVALPWIITIYAISASRLILNLRAAARRQKPDSTWADTLTMQQVYVTSK